MIAPSPVLAAAVPTVILAVVLLAWETVARATAGAFVIAGPVEIAARLASDAPLLLRATVATLRSALAGFALGTVAGTLLAAFALLAPRSERVLVQLSLLAFCLPLVATGPLLRVMMGPGDGPQVALAMLAVTHTTFATVLLGLRSAPAVWFDLVRSHGRGRMAELLHVRLPAALPWLLAGLRIAAPAAILGAMVGEFTGAEAGLGVLTVQAIRSLDVGATWTLASVAAGAAIAAHSALGWVGRRLATPPPLLIAPPPVRGRGPVWSLIAGLATVVMALLLWQVALDLAQLSPFFAKRPADVWAYLTAGPDAGEHRSALLSALGETMAYAVPGTLTGLALGAGLAALLVLAPMLAGVVMPAAVALRAVPVVATAPLLVLALGRGAAGTMAVVALMVFFPTLVACLEGLRRAPRAVLDLFEAQAAPPLKRLIQAQLPAMIPALLASARMSIPAAILAVTTTEWLATGRGLGALMATTAMTSDYAALWSAIVLIGATALLLHAAVACLEQMALSRWAPEQMAI